MSKAGSFEQEEMLILIVHKKHRCVKCKGSVVRQKSHDIVVDRNLTHCVYKCPKCKTEYVFSFGLPIGRRAKALSWSDD